MSGELQRHSLPWSDFDSLARGHGGASTVRVLRRAERSRRMLLLRALVDQVAKNSEMILPLPSPEDAWELLARTEQADQTVLDLILAHPYTGSWLGYATRLLRNRMNGVGPLWAHIGYVHSLAAAAAARANIPFESTVPVWHGDAILPTLGLARLPDVVPWSTAVIAGDGGGIEISDGAATIRVPDDAMVETPGWLPVRQISVCADTTELSVRLDDLDPYRGPYEPLRPQRAAESEAVSWQDLLTKAWRLIDASTPEFAEAMQAGFESVAPRPAVAFRTPSASSGEAFGSAIISRPADAPTLAAMLIHEFQHSQLNGLLHLTRLCRDDPRERCYVAWRDDPRHVAGVLQGAFAFFGMTAFWRALVRTRLDPVPDRAAFEFAYHRAVTWRAVLALHRDPALTEDGARFVAGIIEMLRPWQREQVPAELATSAAAVARDHYLGWRIRHLRPDPMLVAELASTWLTGDRSKRWAPPPDQAPTPVPDGRWSHARPNLVRLDITCGRPELLRRWPTVPDATPADLAWATGRFPDAVRGYRIALARDPEQPAAWAGLALVLSEMDAGPAVRALLDRPELVRAVHRRISANTTRTPSPEEVAGWLGRVAC
jgi:HEXXH motif-containing protein